MTAANTQLRGGGAARRQRTVWRRPRRTRSQRAATTRRPATRRSHTRTKRSREPGGQRIASPGQAIAAVEIRSGTRTCRTADAGDVATGYGEGDAAVDALRGVDVAFAPGTFTAIMGPSGSGKSTLMHILAGLDRPTSGWVEIAGTRLDELSDRDLTLLRRAQVGFIFQSYNLLPVLTAEENIVLPLRHRRPTSPTARGSRR